MRGLGNRPRVLVCYGTRNGGTAGIANVIADTLAGSGDLVDVRPAAWVTDVGRYDAVLLGGAVYAGHWHRDARGFARRFGVMLRGRPVWVFSSGPLDHSADLTDIPPVPQAAAAARTLRAAGHATFGGRLDEYAEGLLARAFLRTGHGGDFRNTARIQRWSRAIAEQLSASASRP